MSPAGKGGTLLAALVALALGWGACVAGVVPAGTPPQTVEAPGPRDAAPRKTSCYAAGVEVPAQRVSLDACCDALRCPPGAHAEWWVTLGRTSRVRCVEGP